MMRGCKGQARAIKEYLESGRSLTSTEAYELFGCTRLAAQIHELKKSGMDIRTLILEGETRYGTVMHYAKYMLVK